MLKELDSLVAQYARSRKVLYDCFARITDAQAEECFPGRDWGIKDTVIHIVTNEKLMTRLLADIAHGTATALPTDFDNQAFNEAQVAAGQNKSMAELRKELEASYANNVAVLETITPEELTRRGVHPAAGDANVKEFFVAMYAHHEVHCRDVVEQTRRLTRRN